MYGVERTLIANQLHACEQSYISRGINSTHFPMLPFVFSFGVLIGVCISSSEFIEQNTSASSNADMSSTRSFQDKVRCSSILFIVNAIRMNSSTFCESLRAHSSALNGMFLSWPLVFLCSSLSASSRAAQEHSRTPTSRELTIPSSLRSLASASG